MAGFEKNALMQRWFLLFRCLKWTSCLSLYMLLCDSFVDVWLSQVCAVSPESEMTCCLLLWSASSNTHAARCCRPFSPGRSRASWTRAAVLLSRQIRQPSHRQSTWFLYLPHRPSSLSGFTSPHTLLALSDLTAEVISLNEEVSSCKKGTVSSESFFEARNHCHIPRGWNFRRGRFDLLCPLFQTFNTFYDVLHGPAPRGDTFSWPLGMFSSHSRSCCFLQFIGFELRRWSDLKHVNVFVLQ